MIRVLPVILIGAALLFSLSRLIDITAALDHVEDYDWSLAPWVLVLSLSYYVLKSLRWHYYLSVVGIRLPVRRSVLVYLAGQWFAFTPAGEFARAYLLKRYNVDPALASSTVAMQIVTDLLSLGIVGSFTLLRFHEYAVWVLLFCGSLVVCIALFVRGIGARKVASLPLVRNIWRLMRAPLRIYYEGSRAMLAWRPLVIGLSMGIPTIIVGAAILFAVCLGYGAISVDLVESAYIYSVSQSLGAVSMLPHGVGAVEGSSLVLFGHLGTDLSYAAAAIALFRLGTVLWSMLIGGIALGVMRVEKGRYNREHVDGSLFEPAGTADVDS